TQPGRQAQEQPARAPQPPVRISAESAEYFNAENLVVFTGKVVAVQADTTITAERMEVRFAPPAGATGATGGQAAAQPAAEQPGAAGAATGQRIASITALQSVTFRQVDQESGKERYATGEQGIYDAERRTVTLTGAPRLWEGKNVIVGEQMVFHLEDKKVVVKGKVNLVVYPDEAKDAGKGKTSP
ncbi:MAG TPA: LptA/OstA family protein, partial [bacterium]